MKTTMLALFVTFLFSCSEWNEFTGENGHQKPSNPFSSYSNQVILDWNTTAHQTMFGAGYSPLVGSRVQAMVHIAMHDALNNISTTYQTYALNEEDEKANPIAAAATAAHTVLTGSFPDKKSQLDSALSVSLAKVAEGDAKERGIALGVKAGNAILFLRANDGAFQNPIGAITPSVEPGVYQGVPPTPFLFAPFWATMQTFSLESPSQFRIVPQPTLTSERYSKDFNEVKRIGVKNTTLRTEYETASAKYWYELSEIGWNRITHAAVAEKKLDLLSTARLFALVNMALTDSYTAGWDSKFHYNFWRPYTAIHAADKDGNALTEADTTWEPLMDTPPVQDYPSTHSTLGNAAATVLATLLGNHTKFTMTSPSADPQHATRTYKSFSEAAVENAISRVLAGIHFRFSCEAGLDLGKKIGQWTVQNHLKPIKKI